MKIPKFSKYLADLNWSLRPGRLQDWYSVAKIASEQGALEYGKQTGLDVVTVNPALVFGPLLQPTLNTSCQFLVYFLKGFTHSSHMS